MTGGSPGCYTTAKEGMRLFWFPKTRTKTKVGGTSHTRDRWEDSSDSSCVVG